MVKQHWRIADEIKERLPETRVVLMGDHVTALPEETMKECKADFVIEGGDFDFSLLSICNHLEKGKELCAGIWFRENGELKSTGRFALDKDLDELPIIDRELTKARFYDREFNIKKRPFAYIMAGRDCPWHECRFCAWTTMFPKFRVRSPKSVLDEIGMLIEKYGVKEVFDDTGTFPSGKWLEEFCTGMVERQYSKKIRFSCNMRADYLTPERAGMMRKAGFRLLKMGLESGNQATLDKMNKGIRAEQIEDACRTAKKAGLETHLTMMVGYPWETRDDAERTFALAKKLMLSSADVLQATVIVPYPGTPFYRTCAENNWFRFDAGEYEKFDMSEPVLKTPDMSPKEVMEICRRIYKIFYSPRYVAKTLAGARNINDMRFIGRGAKAVIGHIKDFGRKVN